MSEQETPKPSAMPVLVWFRIGVLIFGGPAAHIALIHAEAVERRKLATEADFLRGLSFAMLLPGPEAMQLATYLGWRAHGLAGGLVAGLGFMLPGAAIMIAATLLVALGGDTAWMSAIFSGIRPVIVALVALAAWRLGGRALATPAAMAIALAVFLALVLTPVPLPLAIVAAGLAGLALPVRLIAPAGRTDGGDAAMPGTAIRNRSLAVLAAGLALWGALLAGFGLVSGDMPVLPDIARLMTTAALLTFGGAYGAVTYVGEQAVTAYGWLTAGDLVDGLALAETVPGPLIMFNAFVGTLAGFRETAAIAPAIIAGTVAALFTFLPSFAMVLAGAPYVEALHAIGAVRRALAAITASIVAVIAKLALFLASAVLWPGGTPDWRDIAIALAALGLLATGRVAAHWLILAGALLGALGLWVQSSP